MTPNIPDRADRALLVRAAWLYYREGLTQAQVGSRLHVSRATAARLLDRARELGIVTIEIDTAGVGGPELEEAIARRFGLADVVVVPQAEPAGSAASANQQVAWAAAQYLRRLLRPGMTVGVGWGDTVMRTLVAAGRFEVADVTLATLTGGIGNYTSHYVGSELGGLVDAIRFVPSPFLASTAEMATLLRREAEVREVLDLARSADASVIGIGGALNNATILRTGIVTQRQLDSFRKRGAVGDILATWYDEHGQIVQTDIDQLRIGIDIGELQTMGNVIAVAGGGDKLQAIGGALSGGYVDVLITTEDVARSLIALPLRT